MVRKRFCKTSVYCECTVPETNVFTVCDKCGVFVELSDDSFEDTVSDVVHLHLGNFLALSIVSVTDLCSKLLNVFVFFHRLGNFNGSVFHLKNLFVGEHKVFKECGVLFVICVRSDFKIGSKHKHSVVSVNNSCLNSFELFSCCNACIYDLLGEYCKGIELLPFSFLFGCSV